MEKNGSRSQDDGEGQRFNNSSSHKNDTINVKGDGSSSIKELKVDHSNSIVDLN